MATEYLERQPGFEEGFEPDREIIVYLATIFMYRSVR